jgi:DNA-binding transcriptional MerR regulator
LGYIKKAKELGFTLTEIRELLELSFAADAGCEHIRHKAESKREHREQDSQPATDEAVPQQDRGAMPCKEFRRRLPAGSQGEEASSEIATKDSTEGMP